MITIVYGPQASGKTRNKEALARQYAHTNIIDGVTRQHRSRRFRDDNGKTYDEVPSDALLLTCMTREQCSSFAKKHELQAYSLVSIKEALAELEEAS